MKAVVCAAAVVCFAFLAGLSEAAEVPGLMIKLDVVDLSSPMNFPLFMSCSFLSYPQLLLSVFSLRLT